MFIIDPDSFLLPTYRISPFATSAIDRNRRIDESFSNLAIDYFNSRFGSGNWLLTSSGREAIALALEALNVKPFNNLSILTPSNNTYISSCVTSTIEKFCAWNRKNNGDIFFVNHEFGYLHQDIEKLSSCGIPLIEDCCTTFFSQDYYNKIGAYVDYSIFSFPKFFDIQIGGLLVGKDVSKNDTIIQNIRITGKERAFIFKVVGFELSQVNQILEKRRAIFDYATSKFAELGFLLRFANRPNEVPSVLLLRNQGVIKDLSKHKEYLNKHGIQNSVFYGEDAFFVPCHQNLSVSDIDYFKFVTENFIRAQC
jgi:dTDP-4-amino-4,6-dideoxygalactose transaminase